MSEKMRVWMGRSMAGLIPYWVDEELARWEMRGKALKPKGRVNNCVGGLLWLMTD